MNEQAENELLQDLENTIKKAHTNHTCLHPGCNRKPIGSHIIARKTLDTIAHEGHVLTWLPKHVSVWDMKRSFKAGKSLGDLYENPRRVGIEDRNKVTEPLFCHDHDEQVFAPLEKQDFSFHSEQVLLLAYRALCSMVLSTAVATAAIFTVSKKHNYQHLLDTPETLPRLQRFQATVLMLRVRELYAQIHLTHDYNQLGWSMYLVNMQPCVAATYFLIPVDDDDAIAIIDGTQTLTVEDAVSFSFLPYEPLNSSVCVISWLHGSQRARRFMRMNRFNELSEKDQQNLFLFHSFKSPVLYILPTWWQSLSDVKREEYKTIHHDAGREHAKLV